MNEYVLAAIVGLNEAEAFGGVEELDGTCGHDDFLSNRSARHDRAFRGHIHIDVKEKIVERALRRRTKFVSRSIVTYIGHHGIRHKG
jgi:hypothetical protein